jgi:hypothetical protein
MLHIYSIIAIIWWTFELSIILRSRVTAPTEWQSDRVKEWQSDGRQSQTYKLRFWENALKTVVKSSFLFRHVLIGLLVYSSSNRSILGYSLNQQIWNFNVKLFEEIRNLFLIWRVIMNQKEHKIMFPKRLQDIGIQNSF